MKFNPNIHKRKSIRLKGYDYSQEGLYFITISVKDKLCLFGGIKNDLLELFDSGKMVEEYWLELVNKFDNVKLHDYVVMPNHFHGIIEIINQNKNVGADLRVRPDKDKGTLKGNIYNSLLIDSKPGGTHRFTPTEGKFIYNKKSILSIVQWFKTMTTNAYIKNVNNNNRKFFNEKLWQRNFYEHIIRNEESHLKIVNYINNNPIKWNEDKFYYTEF